MPREYMSVAVDRIPSSSKASGAKYLQESAIIVLCVSGVPLDTSCMT